MNSYTIDFYGSPEPRWVKAAEDFLGAPRAVERLIAGEGPQRVSDRQLDVILEWDRMLSRHNGCYPQLECWPSPA